MNSFTFKGFTHSKDFFYCRKKKYFQSETVYDFKEHSKICFSLERYLIKMFNPLKSEKNNIFKYRSFILVFGLSLISDYYSYSFVKTLLQFFFNSIFRIMLRIYFSYL